MSRKNKEPKLKPVKQNAAAESKTMRIIGSPVRVLLIMAVISLLIGLALVKFYESYYTYFDFIVGGIIALIGIANIVFYFCKKTINGVFRSEFAIGVFCMAVGAYIALNGGVSFSFLVVIGALITLDGIIKLQYTFDLLRMRYKKWWLVLIFAVLGIVIGVVLLMDLLKDIVDSDSITYTGLLVCVNAVFDIVVAIVIGIRNRRALKAAENAPSAAETPVELPEQDEPEVEVEVYEEEAEELVEETSDSVLPVAETADEPAGELSDVSAEEEIPAEETVETPAEETAEEATAEPAEEAAE